MDTKAPQDRENKGKTDERRSAQVNNIQWRSLERRSSSRSFTLNGGRSTISRLLFTLPFPLSFSANALQHWEQMSYSLPSISFWRHSLAWLHRSHR